MGYGIWVGVLSVAKVLGYHTWINTDAIYCSEIRNMEQVHQKDFKFYCEWIKVVADVIHLHEYSRRQGQATRSW